MIEDSFSQNVAENLPFKKGIKFKQLSNDHLALIEINGYGRVFRRHNPLTRSVGSHLAG